MPPPLLNSRDLIQRLRDAGVEFVIVGGVAATLHGLDYVTSDIDVCTPLRGENLGRVARSIEGLDPRQRLRPDRAPLPTNLANLTGLRHLCVETTLGAIDFLNEITGLGQYEDVARLCENITVAGAPCRVLTLEALIQAKRAAGRTKDLLALPGLIALLERDDPEKSLFGRFQRHGEPPSDGG
jgi:hypothetical protein